MTDVYDWQTNGTFYILRNTNTSVWNMLLNENVVIVRMFIEVIYEKFNAL
jgi:hypothetical protein